MLSKEEIEKAKRQLEIMLKCRKKQKEEFSECINCNEDIESLEIILQYIDQLENQIQAKEMEHEYDVNMIDEVKGNSVKLYKEIRKQNKIINEMADIIKDYDIDYSDICKYRFIRHCEKAPNGCKECIKQYFEKKVEEK